ncbi:hypothetical protein ACQKGA_00115 [Priestia megaterium]|nr:hypothetical protein [Priestia megaterium]
MNTYVIISTGVVDSVFSFQKYRKQKEKTCCDNRFFLLIIAS